MTEIKDRIAQEISKYGFGISLKDLLNKVYWQLRTEGYEIYLLNDRYLMTGNSRNHTDRSFQLLKTRSKGRWTVKEF